MPFSADPPEIMSDSDVKDLNWSINYMLECPMCFVGFPVNGYIIYRSGGCETVVCPHGHRFWPRLGRIQSMGR